MKHLARLAIAIALWACAVATQASSVQPLTSTDVVPINGDLSASQYVDAAKIDSNYGAMLARFNSLLTALKTIQRDDNTLMDKCVKLYSLSQEVVSVLGSVGGWQPKAAVACASTANLTLSGEQTIDGVLTSASRVLAKDQTTAANNGIYVTGAGAWTRSTDTDTAAEIGYAAVTVLGGTTNQGTSWVNTTAGSAITLGTTSLTFAQFGTLSPGALSVKATGTTTARLLADRAADIFNVLDFGAIGNGVADDTTAVAAAIAAASSAGGKIVYFPPGKYLVTGNLSLANVSLIGTEVGDGEAPYTDNGSQIWETNTSNPMFLIAGNDVTVRGLTFYYPSQDGSTSTPTTYAPTFQFSTTVSCGNINFVQDQWTNAYRGVVCAGTNIVKHGRIMLDRCRAFCLSTFFEGSNIADLVHCSNFEITPGVWQDVALTGNKYPWKWVADNGKAFVLDTQFDGIFLTNGIIFGYNKGVYFNTGAVIDWFSAHQIIFDQCSNGISSNSAGVVNAVVQGCQFWSMHSFTNTTTTYSIDLGGAPLNGDITINGNVFAYSYGFHIRASAQALKAITITGNRFRDWGLATGLASDAYAVLLNNSAGGDAVVSGNSFLNSSATYGCAVGALADNVSVSGNTFRACKVCVNILGAGNYVVTSNSATGTFGAFGCVAGSTYTKLIHSANAWDISSAGHVDSLTATVTFPSMATLTSNLQAVTVPGCQVNDSVALGGPTTTGSNGIIYQGYVSAAGTVTIQALNFTAGSVTPGTLTFRVSIVPRG